MPGPMSQPGIRRGITRREGTGKTYLDKLSGKWQRHLDNRQKRADWNSTAIALSKGGKLVMPPYPKIGV